MYIYVVISILLWYLFPIHQCISGAFISREVLTYFVIRSFLEKTFSDYECGRQHSALVNGNHLGPCWSNTWASIFFLQKKNRWDHLLLTSMLLLDNFSFNVFEARASQRFLVILFFSGVYKMFYACKTKKNRSFWINCEMIMWNWHIKY